MDCNQLCAYLVKFASSLGSCCLICTHDKYTSQLEVYPFLLICRQEIISLMHQHLHMWQDSVSCAIAKAENSFLLQAVSPGVWKFACLVSLPSNLMNFMGHREVSVLCAGPPLSNGGGNTLSPGLLPCDRPPYAGSDWSSLFILVSGSGDETGALITSQMVSVYTPADAWHPLSSWGKDICDPSHKPCSLLQALQRAILLPP